MTTNPADPALDSQIAGRYAVLRRLGRGGMAAVYLVLDELTRRTCAVKQLTIGPDLKGHVEVGVACPTANDNHTAHAPREPHLCGALAQQLLAAGDLA